MPYKKKPGNGHLQEFNQTRVQFTMCPNHVNTPQEFQYA